MYDRLHIRGIQWMLTAMFLFACLDAGIKVLARDFSAAQILAVRFVIFLALIIALIGPVRARAAARARRPVLQVLRCLVLLGEMAVFVVAIRLLPLGDVHAVAASTPLMVTALAAAFLNERVDLPRWIAVIIGMVGLLIVIRPGMTASWAMLVPLFGAFLWALYQLLVRVVSRSDNSDTTLLYTAIVGLTVTGLLAPLDWQEPTIKEWGLLLAVALFGASAHYSLIKALENAPASLVQPFAYSLVLWAVLLGYVLFGDVPDLWTIVGCLIIVGSGVYVWQASRNREAETAVNDGAAK